MNKFATQEVIKDIRDTITDLQLVRELISQAKKDRLNEEETGVVSLIVRDAQHKLLKVYGRLN